MGLTRRLEKYCTPFTFYLLVGLKLCQSLPRSNVVIRGTTMRPNFHRNEGVASVPCPDSHPWAISNGTRCCERFHRAHDYTQNLDWYDPDSFCFESNSIPCPSNAANALCRTDKKFNEPDKCPQTHPIQMKNACCKSYRRKLDGDCDGGLIDADDDPECCRNNEIFQTLSCKAHKKRCFSPAPADVRTYCPVSPNLKRVEGRDYAINSTAEDVLIKSWLFDNCTALGGNLQGISYEQLNDSINFLRTEYSPSELPRGKTRMYLMGARKRTSNGYCSNKEECSATIIAKPSDESITFTSELDSLIDAYQVLSSEPQSIVFEIRLDPLFVKLTTVNYFDDKVGSYFCEVACLDD